MKLGRGGIREIEFFVQTQQLVFGGRKPVLRGRRTLDMLQRLRDEGWIAEEAVTDLQEAYRFLRMVEHRLQMVEDQQTQRLPSSKAGVDHIALFSGMKPAEFRKQLTRHFKAVERHYARLFEDAPALANAKGNLVFTGSSDDPETLKTLKRMGFQRPETAAETVRGWHFGRRAAIVTPRAREVLTELTPALLESFGKSSDPDGALSALDNALQVMPAVVELFTILRQNAALRGLFSEILAMRPGSRKWWSSDRTCSMRWSIPNWRSRPRSRCSGSGSRRGSPGLVVRGFPRPDARSRARRALHDRREAPLADHRPARCGRRERRDRWAAVAICAARTAEELAQRHRPGAGRAHGRGGPRQARGARDDGALRSRPDDHLRDA